MMKQCLKATYFLLFREESKDKFSHHILPIYTVNYGTEMGAIFIKYRPFLATILRKI